MKTEKGNIKLNSFEQIYQGVSLDGKFFDRLKSIENYYKRLFEEDLQFYPNYRALAQINDVLQQETLSLNDVLKAVEILNDVTNKPHHEGSGWLDNILHLRQIAFVYGVELKMNGDFNLVMKG